MNNFLDSDLHHDKNSLNLKSIHHIYKIGNSTGFKRWAIGLGILVLFITVLPWTQNIRSKGYVTALNQQDRTQEINTIIPGKIEKWYVKEGDYVTAGDTIIKLGEIKEEYLDPQLILKTQQQINAKNQGKIAYENKAFTATTQIQALESGKNLKLLSLDNKIGQQRLKIAIDSIELVATKVAFTAYQRQFSAAKTMLDSGAISQTEYEKRKLQFQDGTAKLNTQENKFSQSKQELLNLKIEKNSVVQDYIDKIAKANGDMQGSISSAQSTDADIFKLQNQISNYDIRRGLYYVLASQSGQIVNVKKTGIGELIKENEMLAQIVPNSGKRAVEVYVDPMDLPLVKNGEKARFVFDGFPAIVFSGWPKGSYGTFGGRITAVETFANDEGKFRILISEDLQDGKWPPNLRMGAGANAIILLNDVPIFYELWRNINGFPAEFYAKSKTSVKK